MDIMEELELNYEASHGVKQLQSPCRSPLASGTLTGGVSPRKGNVSAKPSSSGRRSGTAPASPARSSASPSRRGHMSPGRGVKGVLEGGVSAKIFRSMASRPLQLKGRVKGSDSSVTGASGESNPARAAHVRGTHNAQRARGPGTKPSGQHPMPLACHNKNRTLMRVRSAAWCSRACVLTGRARRASADEG